MNVESNDRQTGEGSVPFGLKVFAFALMGPAMGINAAPVALAIPAMTPYGTDGLFAAGIFGIVLGIIPARWLARKIHEGIKE